LWPGLPQATVAGDADRVGPERGIYVAELTAVWWRKNKPEGLDSKGLERAIQEYERKMSSWIKGDLSSNPAQTFKELRAEIAKTRSALDNDDKRTRAILDDYVKKLDTMEKVLAEKAKKLESAGDQITDEISAISKQLNDLRTTVSGYRKRIGASIKTVKDELRQAGGDAPDTDSALKATKPWPQAIHDAVDELNQIESELAGLVDEL
jgi:chromosome segregation ATPase